MFNKYTQYYKITVRLFCFNTSALKSCETQLTESLRVSKE